MKKDLKLYNIIFPIWLLLLVPPVWLLVLPANFIVDSLVILITMDAIGITRKKKMYKKSIFKVWIFGFLSDIIGTLFVLGASIIFNEGGLGDDPAFTIPGVIIAAVMIFIFNYLISFKRYDKATRFKMAISLAIFTAPYTFLIPTSWIYY